MVNAIKYLSVMLANIGLGLNEI